jgi:hypothetical protein
MTWLALKPLKNGYFGMEMASRFSRLSHIGVLKMVLPVAIKEVGSHAGSALKVISDAK